jgi:hypothetical protein
VRTLDPKTGGGTERPVATHPSVTPERVAFLDADRVIVIDRNPETGFARAQVYGPKGALPQRLGPADGIALATVGGVPAIVTYARQKTPKGIRHDLAAYRRDTLKPLAKKSLAEDGSGRVALLHAAYKPLFFLGGYAELVAQKEGDYDKTHDIRKPDMAARVDVFSGKLLAEHEITDVIAWAQLLQIRKKHENERDFLRYTEDLHALQLVDAADRISPVETPRPLAKYDPPTLAYQPEASGALLFSLTIDPVNADAVRAQKADKDWLDFYRLDVATRALTPLVRLDGEKRASTWHAGGGRVGLLRKHKGFGRGGADLEIYDVPQPASATKAPVPAKTEAPAAKSSAPATKPDAPAKTEAPAKKTAAPATKADAAGTISPAK